MKLEAEREEKKGRGDEVKERVKAGDKIGTGEDFEK